MDEDQWIAMRVDQHRNSKGPRIHHVRGGDLWLQITERKTSHGDIVAIYSDITELKKREEELRESEERYALALQGSNEGLWDHNLRTDEIYISPYIDELIGFRSENLKVRTRDFRTRIHPDDLERAVAAWEGHVEGEGDHYACEYRVLDAYGNLQHARQQFQRQDMRPGAVTGLAGAALSRRRVRSIRHRRLLARA